MPTGPAGPEGSHGPRGLKGRPGPTGPTGPAGSSILSFFPFGATPSGVPTTTYSDGSPAQVGIASLGESFAKTVSGGLTGTIVLPDCEQYGFTMPINCILDSICLSVGSPGFTPADGQRVHAFAMLAIAEGNSQQFTLQAAAKAEVVFSDGASYPKQVKTITAAGLGFGLTTETRCMIVCGHHTTGDPGSTSYAFTYSGTLLFK